MLALKPSLNLPSALQNISPAANMSTDQHLWIKRDDLIHPIISGNKARKLDLLLEKIKTDKPSRILSMGGNRSNFLHALSYICKQNNIELHALIRGHQPKVFHKTLRDLQQWGTQLSFISKDVFKSLRENTHEALKKAKDLDAMWLPEGGSNSDALLGIIKSIQELHFEPNQIFVPVGTGCTALGLALGCKERGWQTEVIGVVVLKQATEIATSIQQLASQTGYALPNNLILEHNFCGKGFGKVTEELISQQQEYENTFSIPLEPVYSVKMLNAFKQYQKANLVKEKTIIWHTGGLQGNTP